MVKVITMTLKLALLIFSLVLPAGVAFPQAAKKSKEANNVKTVRVHIDGFQKSKSGSV
jgi:hypothetical protein